MFPQEAQALRPEFEPILIPSCSIFLAVAGPMP